MADWLGTKEIATLLDVSESTVWRSFVTPEAADEMWGKDNWRRKPIVRRTIWQVRKDRIEKMRHEADSDG
jgi:hypothetical protein